jgi:hypothetical protein
VVDDERSLNDDAAELRREEMERHGDGADIAAARDRVEDTSGEEFKYDDGFTWKTVLGALFVALIMAPGAIYLGLVAGSGLGAAAQWVTIVLFAEVARRSFIPLKKQEIYILFYVAGGLAGAALADRGLSGGPFGNMIWNQYFIQSTQAAPFAAQIPHWVAPQPGSTALTQRTFFHPDWAAPIGLLLLSSLLERASWIPAGYILFRATSDVERLPFPLASVAASGATALAEASQEDSWRWRIFSTGTVIGLIFGAFYIAIPVLTGVAFGTPITLIPIPFMDLISSTQSILPAAPVGYSGDLGKVLAGFVLPFPMVCGQFISSIFCQMGLNPVFYHAGLLPHWKPSMDSITTNIMNGFDLWTSIGVGSQIAIALIGFFVIIKGSIEASRNLKGQTRGAWNEVPDGRGDKPHTVYYALGIWLLATAAYVGMTHYYIPLFPLWLLLTYGFVWTPINSFVAARMVGLTSQGVNFPFLQQLTVLESGYKRVDVWFAPMPLHNYGGLAQTFREVELTGTKFVSILKAEMLMLPLILISGLLYWQFIWHTSPVPSPQYPFAQKLWPVIATQQAIWNQINRPGGANWVLDAIKPKVIWASGGVTIALYAVMSLAKAPILSFYGAVAGSGSNPADTIPLFIGACLGKFYFAKRVGVERWTMYAPVLLAGFACGTGLVSMAAIALALIAKAVQPLPF